MMEKKVKLIYTLDVNNEISIPLYEGSQKEIDKITTQFQNSKELREIYKEKINLLRTKAKTYIEKQQEKTKRKETGDIVIIDETNKRIRVLYQRHIKVFEEIITDIKFLEYILKNYPTISEILEDNSKYVTYSHELIRKIYGIYKDEYKEKTKIKKQKQEKEEQFVGSLLEEPYTKKIGGM